MKDHETFAKAARLLVIRRADVRFVRVRVRVCVGEGIEPYRSTSLASLQVSALDVATSSSRFGEGFSNAIGEAMACGVPCSVIDVGDSRLIVGDTRQVVPPRDPEALVAAWEKMLDNGSPELSFACCARIADHFSVARLVAATEDAILPQNLQRFATFRRQ